jgi:hypothetical protein
VRIIAGSIALTRILSKGKRGDSKVAKSARSHWVRVWRLRKRGLGRRALAYDGSDVCYIVWFLAGKEMRDRHLGYADWVGDSNVNKGIAGFARVISKEECLAGIRSWTMALIHMF